MTTTETVPVVNVERPPRKPNKIYPSGEVCADRQCDAILSIYNPIDLCALHHRFVPGTNHLRGCKRKPIR